MIRRGYPNVGVHTKSSDEIIVIVVGGAYFFYGGIEAIVHEVEECQ